MPSASDYLLRLRQRLLLDWDDSIFRGPLFVGEQGNARKKLTDLVSPCSDDAVTWNVFRILGRLPAEVWLPVLLSHCVAQPRGSAASLHMEFWRRVPPPRSRLCWMLDNLDKLRFHDVRQEAQGLQRLERVRKDLGRWRALAQAGPPDRGDGILEGPLELDVILTTTDLRVVVEAKYTGDIELATAWDPQRDQMARCLDAALELAVPQRAPYFLLITDDYVHEGPETPPKAYEALLPQYRDDAVFRAARLPHRSRAELGLLEGHVGWMTWADLVDVVLDHSAGFTADQKGLLRKLVEHLKTKKLLHKGG